MQKKIEFVYYNDESHGVALSIDSLHSSTLVPKQSYYKGEIELSDDEYLFIKKWDKMVMIAKGKFDNEKNSSNK